MVQTTKLMAQALCHMPPACELAEMEVLDGRDVRPIVESCVGPVEGL